MKSLRHPGLWLLGRRATAVAPAHRAGVDGSRASGGPALLAMERPARLVRERPNPLGWRDVERAGSVQHTGGLVVAATPAIPIPIAGRSAA
jgi:hypothetical protein